MSKMTAKKRKNDFKHMRRKMNILKNVYHELGPFQLHRLSKGKVHCFCPYCSKKRKDYGLTIQEQKAYEAMKFQDYDL